MKKPFKINTLFYLFLFVIISVFESFLLPQMIPLSVILGIIALLMYLFSHFLTKKYLSTSTDDKITQTSFLILTIFVLRFMTFSSSDLANNITNGIFVAGQIAFLIQIVPLNLFIIQHCIHMGFSFDKLGLKFKKLNFQKTFTMTVATASLCFFYALMSNQLQIFNHLFTISFALNILVGIITTTFIEELLVRGVLFSHLMRITETIEPTRLRFTIIVCVNTLVFVLLHNWFLVFNIQWLLTAILISLFGCISRFYCNNISFVIVLHAFINFVVSQ